MEDGIFNSSLDNTNLSESLMDNFCIHYFYDIFVRLLFVTFSSNALGITRRTSEGMAYHNFDDIIVPFCLWTIKLFCWKKLSQCLFSFIARVFPNTLGTNFIMR